MSSALSGALWCVAVMILSIAAGAVGDGSIAQLMAFFSIYFAFDAVFSAFGGVDGLFQDE